MQRLIPALAFASGMCGIAYELIYARLLTTYLGDMFHVAAAILATFMLGISAGAFVAHRFLRWLWAVELGIGLYAAGLAWVLAQRGDAVLHAWVPVAAGSPAAVVGVVAAVLAAPALLIGFSVPLFTALLRMHAPRPARSRAFGSVYGLYNVGAALCVLLAEFILLRSLGIRGALAAFAAVNAATGLALLAVPTRAGSSEAARVAPPAGVPRSERPPRRALAALFLASVASGIYQMFFFKIAETVHGPFHENFALVVALALGGIAAGTALAERRGVSFERWLLGGAAWTAASLAAVGPLVYLWAALHGALGGVPVLGTGLKVAHVALLGGVPFAVFGGTVPALLRSHPAPPRPGTALAVSGTGNAAGYLVTVLWLYAAVPERVLAVGLAVAVALAGLVAAGSLPRPRALAAPLAAAAGLALAWPSLLLHLGHVDYASWGALREARRSLASVEVHRRFDSKISLLRREDGRESLIINGYPSLVAATGGRTNLQELLFGLTPALYSAGRDRALVLGVGTGITAGGTAHAYDRVTAVEVNPSMLALLPEFAEHNGRLHESPKVELVLDDGLSALVGSRERYDAIVNTVTTPLYFASSKLYTRDFFDLVSERLAPGGVYATWFDSRVTEAGARIIFRTLRESFSHCAVTYLNAMYLQLLCGDEPLRARPVAWDPRLRARFERYGLGLGVDEILRALSFGRHRLFETRWRAPVNTFDRPVLEFLMARRGGAGESWSPYELLGVDLRHSPLAARRLSGAALGERCFLIRALGVAHDGCLAALERDADALSEYAGRIVQMARARDARPDAYERLALARVLAERGRLRRAEELLAIGNPPPRARRDVALARARLALRRGEAPDRALLEELYGSGPVDADVREVIARALARRGRPRAALAHLDFLGLLEAPGAEAVALRSELRARVALRSGGAR